MIDPGELHRYFMVRDIARGRDLWVLSDTRYTVTDEPAAQYQRGEGPMTTKRLTRDDELATAAEEALTKLMLDARELPGVKSADEDEDLLDVEVNVIETYREAGLLTSDRGLVVYLSDGRELHLTITAYGPAGSRQS